MPSATARIPTRPRKPRWGVAIAAAMLLAGAARGAALTPGDILVTDLSAKKLYAIDRVSGLPTELAVEGFLINPVGVAVRADGFAFLTDIGSQLVIRIDPTATLQTPVQVAISALANARGITIDPSGDAFVSSPSSDEIIRIDTVTGTRIAVSVLWLDPLPGRLGARAQRRSGRGGFGSPRLADPAHPPAGRRADHPLLRRLVPGAARHRDRPVRRLQLPRGLQLPGGRLDRAQGLPGRRDHPVRPPESRRQPERLGGLPGVPAAARHRRRTQWLRPGLRLQRQEDLPDRPDHQGMHGARDREHTAWAPGTSRWRQASFPSYPARCWWPTPERPIRCTGWTPRPARAWPCPRVSASTIRWRRSAT